jgi:hypothetical protein
MGDMNLCLKLPYKIKTLNRDFVRTRSASASETTVSNSNWEIQSADSVCGSRRKGRYFALISGSSSASDMASCGHCARVRSCLGAMTVPIRRNWELFKVFARGKEWFRRREAIMEDDVVQKI